MVAAQRQGLAKEIAGLEAEAERVAEKARELAGEVRFQNRMIRRPDGLPY